MLQSQMPQKTSWQPVSETSSNIIAHSASRRRMGLPTFLEWGRRVSWRRPHNGRAASRVGGTGDTRHAGIAGTVGALHTYSLFGERRVFATITSSTKGSNLDRF